MQALLLCHLEAEALKCFLYLLSVTVAFLLWENIPTHSRFFFFFLKSSRYLRTLGLQLESLFSSTNFSLLFIGALLETSINAGSQLKGLLFSSHSDHWLLFCDFSLLTSPLN